MKLHFSLKLTLLAILLLAASFRFHNINWDQGFHLHPDERAIIMATEKLQIPQTLATFLLPNSPWNPHFFAYGSFPFYLLYGVGQLVSPLNPAFTHYEAINIPGRFLSGMSDLLIIIVLFFLGRKLFNARIGLLSSFFYAISVLPIQLSHFYAVDTLLTLFILLTLYQLVLFYEKPSIKRGLLIGLFFGLALATKVSAFVLIVAVGMSLVADFLLIFLQKPHKPFHWLPHVPVFFKHLATYAVIILMTTLATFIFFEPYAVIDFSNFWQQTLQQSAMTRDAFTFPYTLQYVGKIPYLYELKNIFFFGLGPIIALLSFVGLIFFIKHIVTKNKQNKWAQEIILLTFFFAYFLTVGNFAIGFMRYMLPLYPFFCLFAAISTYWLLKKLFDKNKKLFSFFSLLFALLLLIWPVSFVQIYNHYNTRVQATDWINIYIPQGKTLAVEHWDDRLPLLNSPLYVTEELELYNPDSEEKWQKINAQLERTDFLIIASNRLYTPLQKMTNCTKLPPHRCYPKTAIYYQQLFQEKIGFTKVAEFASYPTIPFLNIRLNDQHADESFTVYDHPKVMIFKKN